MVIGETDSVGGQQARDGWRASTVVGTAATVPKDAATSEDVVIPETENIIDPLKGRAVNDIANLPPSPLDGALKTLHGRVSAIPVKSTTVEAIPVLPAKTK